MTVTPGGTSTQPVVLYAPTGMTVDGDGNLFVADFYYMLIREVQSNFAVLDYTAVPVRQGDISAPQDQTVENDGNAASTSPPSTTTTTPPWTWPRPPATSALRSLP